MVLFSTEKKSSYALSFKFYILAQAALNQVSDKIDCKHAPLQKQIFQEY